MESSDPNYNQNNEMSTLRDPDKTKVELHLQENSIGLLRRHFSRLPKSHIYLIAVVSLVLVASGLLTVLIMSSGNQSVKEHGSTINNETLFDTQKPETLLDPQYNQTFFESQIKEDLLDIQANGTLSNTSCENFYEFSCKLWNQQNPRPEWREEWSVYSASLRKINKLILEILEEPLQQNEIKGFKQAKFFYKKCFDFLSLDENYFALKSRLTIYGMPVAAGQATRPPINELCSELVRSTLTSAVVHKYVMQKYSNICQFEEIRTQVQQMFDNIKLVFDSADTPLFPKLAKNIKVCIGFPDWLLNRTRVQADYNNLLVEENDSLETQIMKLTECSLENMGMKVQNALQSGDAVECWKDHTEIAHSVKTAVTIFSKLDPSLILIYIPLGMLEPPYFQLDRSLAMNYGSLGFTIGHELGHAFLGHNWTASTNITKSSLVQCLKQQYSALTVDESISLNGELTLAENLPDNLGLLASYIAFSKVNGNQHRTDSRTSINLTGHQQNQLGQLTDEQVFFRSFSQSWCESTSKEYMTNVMQKLQHAPAIFRVMGTLENSEEFAKSWNCSYQRTSHRQNCQTLLGKNLASGILSSTIY